MGILRCAQNDVAPRGAGNATRIDDSILITVYATAKSRARQALWNNGLTTTLDITLPVSDGKSIVWLYQHGTVLSQTENEGNLYMKVRLTRENKARWEKMAND
jgi:hypothetical protein